MLSHLPNGWTGCYNNHYSTSPTHSNAYQSGATINPDIRDIYSNLRFTRCHTFNLPTETASNDMDATITNCQYIGSYNWVSDHNDVSIIVPGSPREWQERPLPHAVPPDILGHYREQYDCRMRSTPLLPLLLAVNHWHERTHPSQPSSEKYPWHDVDFVTNRNSLRHLLRIFRIHDNGSHGTGASVGGKKFHQGGSKNPHLKPFRIDIELAGTKTILLNRWEPIDSEPLYVNSYGFNFENAFTREAEAVSDLDESGETARHHRINSYDFGGLQMVVRSEIDACIPPLDDNDDTLLPNDPIEPTSPLQHCSSTKFGLKIIPSPNAPTPQTHLIELSTVKFSTFPTWNARERYPQLYFSQVPNHYLACHTDGTIQQIDKRDLHKSPEIVFYAPIVEPKLRMLRNLLGMIQKAVITHECERKKRMAGKKRGGARRGGRSRSFSLVYSRGQLILLERVGSRCLPEEAFAMFEL